MTRVLVYEYTCATRPGDSRAASLAAEGAAMLAAAVKDFRSAGVDVITVSQTSDEEETFRNAARDCDFALVIAPESNGILETRCRWAVEAGVKLLGPLPDVVALCADKLTLAEVWNAASVPTPSTTAGPLVVKPRFGAGAIDTRRFGDGFIAQQWVAGQAASCAAIVGPKGTLILPPASQDVAVTNDLPSYRGGTVPLPQPYALRARSLAAASLAAVPGIVGYVGVDLVLGEHDVAIEINPRLTTSYVGLRRLCRQNLMKLLLDVVGGFDVAEPDWRDGPVTFDAAGNASE